MSKDDKLGVSSRHYCGGGFNTYAEAEEFAKGLIKLEEERGVHPNERTIEIYMYDSSKYKIHERTGRKLYYGKDHHLKSIKF
jgi:hypothetical protein